MKKNLKILFINPPYCRLTGRVYIYIPLGISILGAVTRDAGYETYLYSMDIPPMQSETFNQFKERYNHYDDRDLILMNLEHDPLQIWQELEKVLDDIKPDVVGISALTPQIPVGEKVAQICKKYNPQIITIIGGVHASFRPEELIRKDSIDYVFSGDAEEGITEFLHAVQVNASPDQMKLIKGLSSKKNSEIHIAQDLPLVEVDKYPMASRDLFVFPERIQSQNMGFILTGRGCPFKCKFCASPTLSGNKVRKRPVEHIVDEIEDVINTYGTEKFMFWEDTFVTSKKRARQFADLLIKRNLNIQWRCHTRLDTLSEEILDIMISTGCKQINVGIESGSDKILHYINKKISTEKIIKKLELLRSKNIPWSGNFMIGFPEEKPEDIEKTIEFIKTNVKNHIALCICVPYPGTQFFEDCLRLGIINNNKPIDWTMYEPQSKYACFSKYLNRDQLNKYAERIREITAPYKATKTPGSFSPCERI